jgi:hypothetical protein
MSKARVGAVCGFASVLVVVCASCSTGSGGGKDGGAAPSGGGRPSAGTPEGAMYDGIVLPPGSEEREDAAEDPFTTVPMGGSTSESQDVKPGGVITVSLPFNAQGGNVVGAGIRFSDSGPFKFIPIPAARGQKSGTLSFQFQAPPGVCGSLSSICHQIKCYEFAVTAAGTISKANITQLAIACNNCTEPSCQSLLKECKIGDAGADGGSCSSVQTAGADTPETRTIEMGRTSGTFDFTYDMFTQKDQMTVSYGGTTLFDTGCVSNGSTKTLSYSGSSTKITVAVKPNCAGGTGTKWEFSVGCPR